MSAQVEKTQSAVKKEQGLAAKLKEEISAVNNSSQKQMQLEKEKVEATEAERSLVEKSLKAERQKVSNRRPRLPMVNFKSCCASFCSRRAVGRSKGIASAAALIYQAAELSPCCLVVPNDAL